MTQPTRAISELLCAADSLGAAAVALAREYPELSISDLLAAERAEVLELGWDPTAAHRDCAYLVTMVAMLRPMIGEHGDLPLAEAFRILIESGHREAREIADALADG